MPLVSLQNLPQLTAVQLIQDPGHDPHKHVIPTGVKVRIVWGLPDGKQGCNVLGMQVGGSFVATAAIAESMRAFLTTGGLWTAYAAFLHPSASLLRVELQDLRQLDQPLIPSTGAAVAGTGTGTALPSEVALCGTLRTSKIGRGNRGRVYLCGFVASAVAAGDLVSAGLMTAAGGSGFLGLINGAMTTAGGQWALIQPHRLEYTSANGTPHDERPAGMLPITTYLLRDNHWDTQRRRGLK